MKLLLTFGLCIWGAGSVCAQMTQPGSFGVSPSGAATYDIPIQVAPGVAGIEPKLSLSFNSQSGNGLLGLNWNLSGLSAITRCPQTKAQDGASAVLGINYASSDRFCLDGQRLMVIAGAYGATGSEYRTEIEAYSKVVAEAVSGVASAPAKFTVKTKAGLTMEYGGTIDSRVPALGQSSEVTRVWMLNRVADTKGNSMTFSYTARDPATGQSYISTINYTSNASVGLVSKGLVTFNYELRPDVQTAYVSGGLIKTDKRLKSIVSSWNGLTVAESGVTVAEYGITYLSGSGAATLSLLDKISRTTGAGTAPVAPTTMKWIIPAATTPVMTKVGSLSGKYGEWVNASDRIKMVDIDGDGRTDVLIGPDANGKWYWMQSTGSSFVDKRVVADAVAYAGWDARPDLVHLFDVDADQLPDIVLGPNAAGQWYWLKNTGSTFVDKGLLSPQGKNVGSWYWSKAKRVRILDINGDGRSEVVFGPDGAGNVYVSYISGTTSPVLQEAVGPIGNAPGDARYDDDGARFVDMNGDGIPDLVDGVVGSQLVTNNDNGDYGVPKPWYFMLGNGAGYGGAQQAVGSTYGYYDKITPNYLVDINGDGLLDVLIGPAWPECTWCWLQSSGKGYIKRDGAGVSNYGSLQNYNAATVKIFDINGDGLQDVLLGPAAGGVWYWMKSTGDGFVDMGAGFVDPALNGWNSIPGNVRQADFDGDGIVDTVLGPDASGNWHLLKGTDLKPRAQGFSDGRGSITFLSQVLTKVAGVSYVRDVAVAFPKINILAPMQVVTDVFASDGGGNGGLEQTSYKYGNLIAELNFGRGLQGFGWMQSRNESTGMVTKTYFRQDFPFTGQVSRSVTGLSESDLAAGGISETTNTFKCLKPGQATNVSCAVQAGERYFVYSDVSEKRGRDIDSSRTSLPWTRIETDVNPQYGDVSKVTTSIFAPGASTARFAKTLTNEYAAADATNWLLGRLKKSTVVSTGPAGTLPGADALNTARNSGAIPLAPPPALPASVMVPILDLLLND